MSYLDLSGTKLQERKEQVPFVAGEQMIMCMDAAEKTTKSGTGKYLEYSFEIVGGDFNRWKLKARFNIENDNEQAVEIGKSQLKTMLHAMGLNPDSLENIKDPVGQKCRAWIGLGKTTDQGKRFPEIKNFIAQDEPVKTEDEMYF